MWKLHTAVVVIAGAALILGLSGAQLIAGTPPDRWLADLDIWLQGGLSYPTLWAFGFGVLVAYAIFGLWLLGKTYELIRWLVRLTDLWAEGMAIRADGLALATDSQVTAWVERRYTGWHNRVVDTLEPVAPVDARLFATTLADETSEELTGTFRSAFHRTNLLAMSREADKLKAIVDRHQARMSPAVTALIVRLQRAQGGTFGNIPRARELSDAPAEPGF